MMSLWSDRRLRGEDLAIFRLDALGHVDDLGDSLLMVGGPGCFLLDMWAVRVVERELLLDLLQCPRVDDLPVMSPLLKLAGVHRSFEPR